MYAFLFLLDSRTSIHSYIYEWNSQAFFFLLFLVHFSDNYIYNYLNISLYTGVVLDFNLLISVHNSKQNKLVKSLSRTRYKVFKVGPDFFFIYSRQTVSHNN